MSVKNELGLEVAEFGPDHPTHSRVPWAEYEWHYSVPIYLPKAVIHHLESNIPLSKTEINLVKELQRIVQLQIILKRVKGIEGVDRLEKTSFAYDVMLSPFRRVTHDVIHEVASYFQPRKYFFHGDPDGPSFTSSFKHTPSMMARTSSMWRSTVRSMSALWRYIHVDGLGYLPHLREDTARRSRYLDWLVVRMKLFAELSKSQPLSIQLDWDPSDYRDYLLPNNGLQHILDRIIQWAPERLTKLIILTSDFGAVWRAIGQPRHPHNQLPSVETLMVLRSTSYRLHKSRISDTEFSNVLQMFPKLQHFWSADETKLDNNFLTQDSQALRDPTPFLSLTAAYFETYFSSEQAVGLLAMCPQLEWLSIPIRGIWDDGNTLPPRVVHTSLKEMHLMVERCKNNKAPLLQIFSKIRFQKLTLLSLDLDTEFMVIDSTSDQELQDRFHPRQFVDTFPSLQTLEVSTSERTHSKGWIEPFFDPRSIFPLLLSVPSIKVFSFASIARHLEHISSILQFIRQSDTSVLPNLESLYIGYRNRAEDIEEAYEDIEELWAPDCYASTDFGRLAHLKQRVRIVADCDYFDESPLLSLEEMLRTDYNLDITFEIINPIPPPGSRHPIITRCLISDIPHDASDLDWYTNTQF
ncbi:hypothetical protein CVT24_011198 [Panaeolus cyanescens]|uniref:F-box domain-containing protein n=1 Tax=Panaeolus cyanescens TaxID=181874 RepID=A0A409VIA2_9AGAR|nr:hypothetical protein CVT24_011198 [Panaeolus cyanescens]